MNELNESLVVGQDLFTPYLESARDHRMYMRLLDADAKWVLAHLRGAGHEREVTDCFGGRWLWRSADCGGGCYCAATVRPL